MLWIARVNAAARAHGLTYSRFMEGIKAAGIDLDRKVLSDLAITEDTVFQTIVAKAVDALKSKAKAA